MFCFKLLHVSEMLFLCPVRNPSASPQGANKVSRDPSQRIHNLSLLVQQIRTYYQVRRASLLSFLNVHVGHLKAPAAHHAAWRWRRRRHPCGSARSS